MLIGPAITPANTRLQYAAGPAGAGSETQYLRPTSNVNTLWNTNAYTSIDEEVVAPDTSALDGNMITANKNDDSEGQQWGAALGDAGTYASLKLWIYGYRGGTAPNPTGRLNINGSWQSAQAFSLGVGAGSPGWSSVTFTGPFTLPLSSLTIEVATGDHPGATDSIVLYAVYVEAVPE